MLSVARKTSAWYARTLTSAGGLRGRAKPCRDLSVRLADPWHYAVRLTIIDLRRRCIAAKLAGAFVADVSGRLKPSARSSSAMSSPRPQTSLRRQVVGWAARVVGRWLTRTESVRKFGEPGALERVNVFD